MRLQTSGTKPFVFGLELCKEGNNDPVLIRPETNGRRRKTWGASGEKSKEVNEKGR
jgi:hypothetical protein